MDIARQGEEIFLFQHFDGFFADRECGFFEIEFSGRRDDEDAVRAAGGLSNERFEEACRILSNFFSHLDRRNHVIALECVGVIGDFGLIEQPHDICFFVFFL